MHLKPAFGPRRLDSITPQELDRLYSTMRKQGLSADTVRLTHASIHRAYVVAIRWGWTSYNPAEHCSKPRAGRKEIVPSTLEEYEAILAEVAQEKAGDALAVFFRLSVATGARPGELCALQWRDVDLDPGRPQLAVLRNLVEVKGGYALKDTKGHSSRRLALDEGTWVLLGAYYNETLQSSGQASFSKLAFVFSHDHDGKTPWMPTKVSRAWASCRARAGVENRLYDLRHLHASQLLDAVVPVVVVAQRLGHSVDVCHRTYAHAVSARDQEAAAAIGAFLNPVTTNTDETILRIVPGA